MAVPAIGITGGIGAGKSEALRAFERHGAAVSSSDAVVHQLFAEDQEVRRALRERYGDSAFDTDGSVDRRAIGSIVFNDPGELTWLESVLHPRVVRADLEWRDALARSPQPPPLTVTEVPLLYETGAEERFDSVVVITAPPDVRAARTQVRADGRDRRLLPDEEKVRRADFAYVNDGSLEELENFVAGVVRRVVRGT
jgi:dephospho-CoA kinase